MDSIERLTERFRRFPGIGPRQARRFVYHLLGLSASERAALSREIADIGKHIETCQSCFRYFPVGASHGKLCSVCSDPSRDRSELMVVSRDADFETIEKSRAYQGLYFVLGGSIPILEKDPASRIRERELVETVTARISQNPSESAAGNAAPLREVILALNLTPEGEHTQGYLEGLLGRFPALKISTLGRGLSTGLELEYSDTETIKNAFKNRA